MRSKKIGQLTIMMLMSLILTTGCVEHVRRIPVPKSGIKMGVKVGAGIGAAVGATVGSPFVGAAIGGGTGAIISLFHVSQEELIAELAKANIEYIGYGDTHTLIIPTDHYFLINSHRFNEICFQGLMTMVRLLRFYTCSPIYVAGFTDEIGSRTQKNKLSQSRADAIVTFLWAHGVRAQRLHAEGYGDKFSVGDNHLIHGSAYNRRIEVQWINQTVCPKAPGIDAIDSK